MLAVIHKAFIDACGGISDPEQIAINQKYLDAKKQYALTQKQKSDTKAKAGRITANGLTQTVNETYELIKQDKSLDEIATARSLALSTIMGHVADIAKTLGEDSVKRYRPEDAVIQEIHQAIETLDAQGELQDGIKLTAIRDELREKYSFSEIRLALGFIDTDQYTKNSDGRSDADSHSN